MTIASVAGGDLSHAEESRDAPVDVERDNLREDIPCKGFVAAVAGVLAILGVTVYLLIRA